MRSMVLNDGETYSGLRGCKIVDVPDDVMAELEAGDIHATDFEEYGTTLHRFDGEETACLSFGAAERQFITDAVDALEEQLQLDTANPDWDGRKWGEAEQRLSASIAEEIKRCAIAELRSGGVVAGSRQAPVQRDAGITRDDDRRTADQDVGALAASYTREQITTAFNRAADEILEATGAPDTGIRDAVNLVVNAGVTYLASPEASLQDAIDACYDLDEDEDGPLDWIADGTIQVAPLTGALAIAISGGEKGEPDSMRREDPLAAVVTAAMRACCAHPSAARYLRDLTRSFAERSDRFAGDGPIVRLERWWDEDPDTGGPLVFERGGLDLLAATADPATARADVDSDGFHDASDPSQPMASLWVRVKTE